MMYYLYSADQKKGDGKTGEEGGDEEEDLPSPHIGQRSYQRGREEAEDPLHSHDHAVHDQGLALGEVKVMYTGRQ